MIKQLKVATTMSAMAIVLLASAPVFAASSSIPSGSSESGDSFWTEPMMKKMDKNKDGQVSRQEFVTYLGAQFDTMDKKKRGMLNKAEFMDKKMISSTFPSAAAMD